MVSLYRDREYGGRKSLDRIRQWYRTKWMRMWVNYFGWVTPWWLGGSVIEYMGTRVSKAPVKIDTQKWNTSILGDSTNLSL